jgi:hypothetical protein
MKKHLFAATAFFMMAGVLIMAGLFMQCGSLNNEDQGISPVRNSIAIMNNSSAVAEAAAEALRSVDFVNRYLSYALKNKPFMWNEYGYGGPWGKHTRHLDGADIVYRFDEMIDLVVNALQQEGVEV